MLDSFLSYNPYTTLKTRFLGENAKILQYIRHVIMAVNNT